MALSWRRIPSPLEMIRHTPPEVIYHRISASARRPTLLAPLWCENRWTGMVELDRYLNQQGAQGSALGRSWVAPELSEYERDVRNNAGHRAPAIYAAGFHRHTRSFDHEQHQQGAKRGDSAGEYESAVKYQ